MGVAILFEASPGFQPSTSSRKRDTGQASGSVAILFEASPGFQRDEACDAGVCDMGNVAILFEASPGFQLLDYWQPLTKLGVERSQSSLKRVLVSNLVEALWWWSYSVNDGRNPL